MPKIIEGSRAIAETINACRPGVVSAYPITPQTHIVEDLAKIKANGEGDFEYVIAESEFAAASIVLGASAAGERVYTATSSQGLLLMTEVLYNIAGMRLPVVMTDANRAISAPINIWNDQQDAVTLRDSGWIMLYGETVQEICDQHILAYKVAEQCALPVMINLDGFVLTHVVEPVEIATPAMVKKYLPAYRPAEKLDTKHPLTLGAFATPAHYMEIRQELHDDLVASKKVLAREMLEFKKVFGRGLSLVEYYGDKNADTVVVAMGSVIGTIKDAVDEMRAGGRGASHNNGASRTGKKIGVLKVNCLRPFPDSEVLSALSRAKNVIVIDKSISLGTEGILATELRRAFNAAGSLIKAGAGRTSGNFGRAKAPKISGAIMGLGGRDITKEMIKELVGRVKTLKNIEFVGR